MKEPITGRDLIVISTLCTGLGALLSWGLFYRWGSAPATKPVDLSAWVQAIGSVMGIFSAAGVAFWQQRINSKEKAEREFREKIQRYTRAHRAIMRFQKVIHSQLNAAKIQLRGTSKYHVQAEALPDAMRDLEDVCCFMGRDEGGQSLTAIKFFEDAQELIKESTLIGDDEVKFIEKLEYALEQSEIALSGIRKFLWIAPQ